MDRLPDRSRFGPVMNGAELVALCSVLGIGFLLVRSGDVSVGTATAAALYVHRAFDPVALLLFLFDDALEALTAVARLVGVASAPRVAPPASSSGRPTGRSRAGPRWSSRTA